MRFTGRRTITYFQTGERVRGLKRDPLEYLRNPQGLSFSDVSRENFTDRIRERLNLKQYNVNLDDKIVLQCWTHKSFAHASKPYNEKLSIIGKSFLRLYTGINSVSEHLAPGAQESQSPPEPNEVNGYQFDTLGHWKNKSLTSSNLAAKFIKGRELGDLVFWKIRDPTRDAQYNGEDSVYLTVFESLIGAILLTQGHKKASQYVLGELLNPAVDGSLINLVEETSQIKSSAVETTPHASN